MLPCRFIFSRIFNLVPTLRVGTPPGRSASHSRMMSPPPCSLALRGNTHRPRSAWEHILILIILLTTPLYSDTDPFTIESISTDSTHLTISCKHRQLIGNDLLHALRKGTTAALFYQFQIWQVRSGWLDKPLFERTIGIKISFDHWEKRFLVSSRKDSMLWMDEAGLISYCSHIQGFPLIRFQALQENVPYRIVIESVLQPLSLENVREMKNWLYGEVEEIKREKIKSTRSPLKKIGDWSFRLLLNLTGFGDRVDKTVSAPFRIVESRVVKEKNP